ncbi:MAG: hypothetical protein MHM6MM_000572 [Cercozoa sp. M6MM]
MAASYSNLSHFWRSSSGVVPEGIKVFVSPTIWAKRILGVLLVSAVSVKTTTDWRLKENMLFLRRYKEAEDLHWRRVEADGSRWMVIKRLVDLTAQDDKQTIFSRLAATDARWQQRVAEVGLEAAFVEFEAWYHTMPFAWQQDYRYIGNQSKYVALPDQNDLTVFEHSVSKVALPEPQRKAPRTQMSDLEQQLPDIADTLSEQLLQTVRQ